MPIIFYRERGRVLPSEAGIIALKAWVESAPNPGEKGARALHIKSLHTPRGVGAKTLSFLWLDIPFRAAGAAVRTGYQPGKTCPLCISLAAQGLSPRGKPLAVPARPSAILLAEDTPTAPEEGAVRGALESNHGEDVTQVRRITYELGKTVETTEDDRVTVLEAVGGVAWQSTDGGHVEPADGFEFVRVRASYLTTAGIDDVARIADSFMVQTESGGVYASLEENYSDEEELQSQSGNPLAEGESVEGVLYFEVPIGDRVSHVIFDCSLEEEGTGLWLRWKIEKKPGRVQEGAFPPGCRVVLLDAGSAPFSEIRLIVRGYSECLVSDEELQNLPTTLCVGLDYDTAMTLQAALYKVGVRQCQVRDYP